MLRWLVEWVFDRKDQQQQQLFPRTQNKIDFKHTHTHVIIIVRLRTVFKNYYLNYDDDDDHKKWIGY